MYKKQINFWLALLLFISGLGVAVSGLVRWLLLPGPGRGGLQGREAVFIFSRHTWTDIHVWLALLFLFLVAVHIILHVDWIKQAYKSLFRR